MTTRERIEATLSRRATDRIPADLWCTPEIMKSLQVYFGVATAHEVYHALDLDKLVWVEATHRRRGPPAEDVRREVRENVRLLGKGGGYIVAPCHMIQPGTPIENIVALYDEVKRQEPF